MFARPRLLPALAALALAGAALLHAAAPAAPAALAQSRPRCPDPVGAIEGLVLRADGQPAAGAEVRAVLTTAAGIGEAVVAVAVAGPDGRYRIEALCLAEYRVRAALATTAGILAGAYDADGDGVPDAVALSAGAPTAAAIDIVLGRVPLPPPTATPLPAATRVPPPTAPPCAIADGAIRGTVRDGAGNPVEGAAIHFRGPSAARRAPALTHSAADGTYALEGLCEGSYYLVATKTLADGTVLSGGHPNAVVLTPDDRARAGVDIVLGPSLSRATATPADLPTAPPPPGRPVPPPATVVPGPRPGSACPLVGSAAGSARLATGEPVEGAAIQLVAQTASGAPAAVSAISQRDGSWLAPRVCAGEYTVLATRITAAQALVGVLDADGDAQPDVVRVDATTPVLLGLDVVMRDVLAPLPSPFFRRGLVWPSRPDVR